MISINLISRRPLMRYLLSDAVCSVFATKSSHLRPQPTLVTEVTSDAPASPKGLHVERGDVPGRVERVLAYLAAAEGRSPDPWERDDLRVSWLTVLRASEDHPDPWRYAFWCYFGITPEKALIQWAERSRQSEAMLALCSLPPKKPVHSVRLADGRKRAA